MNRTTGQRIWQSLKASTPKAVGTAWWLIRITVPVTLSVFLLNESGILGMVSDRVSPFFRFLGLPGQTAFVLITSALANVYSAIAVISTLGLHMREAVIVAVMCLISHGFLIETAVLRKTGSSALRMILLRLLSSLIAGVMLNQILPPMEGFVKHMTSPPNGTFITGLIAWGLNMARLCAKILLLIWGLLFLQRLMQEFGLLKWLSKALRPLLVVFGLPASTSLSWIVANVVGLAYGSAIMIEESEQGRLSRDDADLLNHHVAVSHSQLEDPLLFLTIGLPMHWLIWPRLLLAVAAVWLRRAERALRRDNQRAG